MPGIDFALLSIMVNAANYGRILRKANGRIGASEARFLVQWERFDRSFDALAKRAPGAGPSRSLAAVKALLPSNPMMH